MSVVVMVRERARGSVSTPVVLWAVAMTVVLFMEVVSPSALLTVSGFVITALLGADEGDWFGIWEGLEMVRAGRERVPARRPLS